MSADTPDFAASPLADLLAAANRPGASVDQWNPEHCGQIDIRVDAAGRWFHEGSEIRRPALVKLFARVLRREPDGTYVLVTPAEKMAIEVEDAPLVAVEARFDGAGEGATLTLRCATGELVAVDDAHPLTLRDGPAGRLPYLHVRGPLDRGIEARPTRSCYLDLATHADAEGMVWSGGRRWAVGDPA